MEKIHKLNSALRTKPGDLASANRLKELSREEADQIAALGIKIARTKEKLLAYDAAAAAEESQGGKK